MSRQLQTYFSSLGRIAYRVLKADPENAVACANDQIRKNTNGRYDLVVFDFPGHAGTSELLQLSLDMDYILSPIEADVQSMVSCLSYARTIQDMGISMRDVRIKDIMLLWNKVDRRVKSKLMDYYSDYLVKEGFTLLQCRIHAAHRFSHELEQYGFRGAFRSTYLAPAKALRSGTGLDELVEELLMNIRLKKEVNDGKD